MKVNGYKAEKLAAVNCLGDLVNLLPDGNRLYVLGTKGSGHYFTGISKKWLKTLPQDWKVLEIYLRDSGAEDIEFDVPVPEFEAACGKVLEAKGWRKDKYGFYSIRVK